MLYNALWATPLLRGGHRKNIFCQKIFVTPSVFKLQKWFLYQNGVESNQKSKSDDSDALYKVTERCEAVREVPKDVLKMGSGLKSPSGHRGQLCNGSSPVGLVKVGPLPPGLLAECDHVLAEHDAGHGVIERRQRGGAQQELSVQSHWSSEDHDGSSGTC